MSRLKRIKAEIGLNLIELTVVLAITGLIAVPITAIFSLQLRIPEKLASEVSASRQIQKSTLILVEDAQAAQSFTFGTAPDYGTFAWVELAGPEPVPVTSRYFFRPGKIAGSEDGVITGLEMISSGIIPTTVRDAISANVDGSAFTVVPDTGQGKTLDSTTSPLAVTIAGIDYKLAYSPADLKVTITLLDGNLVGELILLAEPGSVLRELVRGDAAAAAALIILEGIVQFEQVQFQVVDPIWIFDSDNNVWDYTEGKIIVTITQVHAEVGGELGQSTVVEALIADFRPQEVRPVALPPPG